MLTTTALGGGPGTVPGRRLSLHKAVRRLAWNIGDLARRHYAGSAAATNVGDATCFENFFRRTARNVQECHFCSRGQRRRGGPEVAQRWTEAEVSGGGNASNLRLARGKASKVERACYS